VTFSDYELLDLSNGYKTERFGNNIVRRPEKLLINNKNKNTQSNKNFKISAECKKTNTKSNNQYTWQKFENFQDDWQISILDSSLKLKLKANNSLNIGIFPEQYANWVWLNNLISHSKNKNLKILNLFGYTGAASLVMANAGAHVTHVDASKTVLNWLDENKSLNQNLNNKNLDNIKLICEDAQKFINREIKRENTYNAIILDPPAFGQAKNNQFKFDKNILELLESCKKILTSNPEFFLLNCYATGLKHTEAKKLLTQVFNNQNKKYQIKSGDLTLENKKAKLKLNMSVYARFSK